MRVSILGVMAVKHIAIDANNNPLKNAKGIIRREEGSSTTPNSKSTGSIKVAYMVLLVAPHNSSPAITSSMDTGVDIIASKVLR